MSPVAVPSLQHTSPEQLVLRRVKRGKGFSYHDGNGAKIDDDAMLERIRARRAQREKEELRAG